MLYGLSLFVFIKLGCYFHSFVGSLFAVSRVVWFFAAAYCCVVSALCAVFAFMANRVQPVGKFYLLLSFGWVFLLIPQRACSIPCFLTADRPSSACLHGRTLFIFSYYVILRRWCFGFPTYFRGTYDQILAFVFVSFRLGFYGFLAVVFCACCFSLCVLQITLLYLLLLWACLAWLECAALHLFGRFERCWCTRPFLMVLM